MPRIVWLYAAAARLAAAGVALALAAPAAAQTRPVYGGTLRVELRAAPFALDAATVNSEQALARDRLLGLAFESLVRLDGRGNPQPHLALSWTHDADFRHWQFRLRPGIRFHDGTPLTPFTAAQSLAARLTGRRVSVFGETLVIQSETSAPGLLAELAGPRGAVMLRDARGRWQGTGPFRLESWPSPGTAAAEGDPRAVFAAHEGHWRGRPYLDRVEVRLNRPLREQMIAMELGRADVVELAVEDFRRLPGAWAGAPVELMALVLAPERAGEEAWRKLALSVSLAADRASIHELLLHRQGDIAGGLLPQWLSGYAFLFSPETGLERARQLAEEASAALRARAPRGRPAPPGVTLTLSHDAGDALSRVVAERIALSARQAGLTVQVRESGGDLRLRRVRLASAAPREALAALGWQLDPLGRAGLAGIPPDAELDELFEAERAAVESGRVAPLFHLPELAGLAPRVRGWSLTAVAAASGQWPLEEVWLQPGAAGNEAPSGGGR